eukprot:gb/GEZN01010574.1/.p1 GENE.gb/GEZN01010574.1/~~gb/GEZN01010574.1/.p1  ORF type:complete len:223 (+),score=23.50 gb/GEZN01010574.1/:25-693(+)
MSQASMPAAAPRPQRVLLVGQHVQNTALSRILGECFKLKVSKLAADVDYLLPGVVTAVFCKVAAQDFYFAHRRVALLSRLEKMHKLFRNAYVLVYPGTESLSPSYLSHDKQLPPFVLCPNDEYAKDIILGLSQSLTKEREKLRENQMKMLEESFCTPETATKLLRNLPCLPEWSNETCQVLSECLGTIRNIAKATTAELVEHTPIQSQISSGLGSFFEAKSL